MSNTWKNPDGFFLALRCTKQKYGENFSKKGQMKFSTPSSWVKYALEKGEGIGDKLEGSIASYVLNDWESMKTLNDKYKSLYDLEHFKVNDRIYLKDKRAMSLPCFCLYTLKNSMFPTPTKCGRYRKSALIPPSYFRDFADHRTHEQVNALPPCDRPFVTVIKDYTEFEKRLTKKLLSLGLTEEEILFSHISYNDFDQYGENGWFDVNKLPKDKLTKNSVNELTVKSIKFKHQNELRIIINTYKTDIIDFLTNNTIEIGSLDDITINYNEYFDDGITIQIDGEAKLV